MYRTRGRLTAAIRANSAIAERGQHLPPSPGEPPYALIDVQLVDLVEGHPRRVGRLLVGGQTGIGRSDDEEPEVMVVMGILGRRIDSMDVEIDRRLDDFEPRDPGLLRRLPEGLDRQVTGSVHVPAGLNPDSELRMMQEDETLAVRIDDEG